MTDDIMIAHRARLRVGERPDHDLPLEWLPLTGPTGWLIWHTLRPLPPTVELTVEELARLLGVKGQTVVRNLSRLHRFGLIALDSCGVVDLVEPREPRISPVAHRAVQKVQEAS